MFVQREIFILTGQTTQPIIIKFRRPIVNGTEKKKKKPIIKKITLFQKIIFFFFGINKNPRYIEMFYIIK